jgi:transposase
MNDSSLTTTDATLLSSPEAWIGLDWGDRRHAFALQDRSGHKTSANLEHSPERLHQWLKELGQKYRSVSLAVEGTPAPIMAVLVQYHWLTIYSINPVSSDRFRKAFTPSGAKDDLPDAQLLLDMVRAHTDKLRAWQAPDAQTQKLDHLVQARRELVDRRTKTLQRLTSLLKGYYPQALSLLSDLNTAMALEFLRRWPELISLKAARPATLKAFYHKHNVRSAKLVQERLDYIRQTLALSTEEALVAPAVMQLRELADELALFQKHIPQWDKAIEQTFKDHPEAHLFRELPGAGKQMAPRLCVAFGTERDRYSSAASLQKYAGVAPVVERSGQQKWVHWRWNAPKFLRQTLVEWAGLSVLWSAWARRYYDHMAQKKKKHAVILRGLAFKWLRILWKCWQTRAPYNEEHYLKILAQRKSPYAA